MEVDERCIAIKAKCSMEFEFPDDFSAVAAEKAVSHECRAVGRSEMRISKKGRVVTVHIDASDVVAMRAAANACLRALQVFESLDKTLAKIEVRR